jgi:segregation and condensation protein B
MIENLEVLEKEELENKELEEINQNTEPERTVVFEEALEAILFAAGHPISYATLARVFEMTPAKIKDKVFEYSVKYNDSEIPRGVILLTYTDSCQLCTKQHYLTEIREALGIKKSGTLSTSSMEALAIIAYNQPVTRMFVDTLRRADSSYAMGNLLDRGLIESQGRLDAPGRPMLYGTTSDFLRSFGLKSLADLPKTSEELMAVFEKTKLSDTEQDSEDEPIIDPAQGVQLTMSENAEVVEFVEPSADENIENEY